MRPEFTNLAKGRAELEEWFQLAHCMLCDRFTTTPYFLGCSENHNFCGQCVLTQIKTRGKTCPTCQHKFDKPDRILFKAHAEALLQLVDVELPPAEAQRLHKYCLKQNSTNQIIAEILDSQ